MYKTLLLCLCFLACRKSATTSNNSNPVTVKLSECAAVQRPLGNLKICLDSLNDSRCPLNANCIWEGCATAKLTVSINNKMYSFHLSTTKRAGFPPTDTTIANHHFQINKVLPFPGDASNISPYIELNVE